MRTLLAETISAAIHVQMDMFKVFMEDLMPTVYNIGYVIIGFLANKFGGHR